MLVFLEETICALQKEPEDISNCILILPSKRAGGFLKNYLRKHIRKTVFSHKIISIEEFIEELSNPKIIPPDELLIKNYQGMVYRKAAEDIEHYITNKGAEKHIFIGFNALNSAEQQIIQELLETGHTSVFWDVDSYYFKKVVTLLNHPLPTLLAGFLFCYEIIKLRASLV